MAMVGVSEMAIVMAMLFGGGAGIPLSLPPAEPDALLDKLSPAEAVFYSQWAGVGSIREGSDNPTEALLAEPEVQEFVRKLEALARTGLAKAGERDPDARMAAQLVPPIVRTLLTRPVMFYVRDLQVTPDGPKFKGGLVVHLGDNFNEVTRLLKLIPEQATTPVQVGGAEFRQLMPPAPGAPPITFGTRGPYLIVAAGEGEAEALIARAQNAAPTWLTDLRGRFALDRVATMTRLDVAEILKQVAPFAGPQLPQMLQATGLDGFREYVGVTGLDERGFAQFMALDLDGEPRGLLALAPKQTLTADDLAPIPLGSLFALATKLDLGQSLDGALELMGSLDPNSLQQYQSGVQQIEQVLGMRVREDVLASFGDTWTVHTHEDDGGLLSGWTATVSVKDAGKLNQFAQRLMQLAAQAARGKRDPKIEWTEFAEENIYSLSIPTAEVPVCPSWCVTKDHVVVGLFPQAVKSYLLRRDGKSKSIAEQPQVAAVLKGNPQSLGMTDNRRLSQLAYPFVQYGLRMAAGEAMKEQLPVDYATLPSLTSIVRHLDVGVNASRRTERGFEFEQHQVIPGGNVAATAPVTVALLLPAVQAARQSARRVQSMNNLKQIALAMHNYHDTYKSFPARYTTDADGKPLLSWRVYILPFIEENALFEQFHLDEPWDSEHNKKLIPMMPRVYATASVPLQPGHTTYLAIDAMDAALQGPRDGENGKTHPRASRIADITDGTSNTVLTVEANAGSAVIWTKPDDYKYQDANPMAGLRGVYPGIMLMGLCDGSVRAVADVVDKSVIKALFTRNGGEVVQLP
ncbi:MAG: DUF1559 domain-containing protein [Planctomycetales bacterium]|nr:DUF1559 domain-containing protein [Planctomycetales bacterium]